MTIGYDGIAPVTVETVVVSTQHSPSVSTDDLREAVRELVIDPVLERESSLDVDRRRRSTSTRPAGSRSAARRATPGSPAARSSSTPTAAPRRHGGGAFSGKDPSKVDRSAAYAMRWVAKNAVAAGLADRLEVQVAYAIGAAEPVGLYVETFGTATCPRSGSSPRSARCSTCGPRAIIDATSTCCARSTRRPRAFGHFGRELPDFTWERTDRAADLAARRGL